MLRFLEDADLVEQERDDIHRILFAERKTACEFPFPIDVDATIGRAEDGAGCTPYAHLSSNESLRGETEVSSEETRRSPAMSTPPSVQGQLSSANKEQSNRTAVPHSFIDTGSPKKIDPQPNNNISVSAAVMANYAAMSMAPPPANCFSTPFIPSQGIFPTAFVTPQWIGGIGVSPFLHGVSGVGSYYVPHVVPRPPAQAPMVGVTQPMSMMRLPYATAPSTPNYALYQPSSMYQPLRFLPNAGLAQCGQLHSENVIGSSMTLAMGVVHDDPVALRTAANSQSRTSVSDSQPQDASTHSASTHVQSGSVDNSEEEEKIASLDTTQIASDQDATATNKPEAPTSANASMVTNGADASSIIPPVNEEPPPRDTAPIPVSAPPRDDNAACSRSATQSPPIESAGSGGSPSPAPPAREGDTTNADIYYDAVDKPLQSEGQSPTEADDKRDTLSNNASGEMEEAAGQRPGGTVEPMPKTWASLFKTTTTASSAVVKKVDSENYIPDGNQRGSLSAGNAVTGGVGDAGNPETDPAATQLAEVFRTSEFLDRGPTFVLRGIVNRGNWCYVNACLQALMACPPFYHFLRSLSSYVQRVNTSTPLLDAFVKFAMEFPLVDRLGRMTGGHTMQPLEPTYLYSIISRLRSDSAFKGRQEDAEEFLLQIFNVLHEEMVSCLSLLEKDRTDASTSSQRSVNGDVEDVDNSEWQQVGPGRKAAITRELKQTQSPLSQLFLGQLRYGLTQSGVKESANQEPFYTLPLDLQYEDLAAALKSFTKKEQLKRFAGTSKTEVDATRRVTFLELPRVMIFQLKYFIYTEEGVKKIMRRMEYSMDLVVDRELLYTRGKASPPSYRQYKLFAVVFHHGATAEGGHYTVDIFHGGQWVHVDDTEITSVNNVHVLSFQPPRVPYLLFYRRWDTSDSQR